MNDKHIQLCELINSICEDNADQYPDLQEMKTEIAFIYKNYKERLNEVKGLILEYHTIEESIRSRLRKILREKRTA